MTLPGETIATGAPRTCPECGSTPTLRVLKSAAGYYIGTMCHCGPYSRESGYYKNYLDAKADLESGEFWRN